MYAPCLALATLLGVAARTRKGTRRSKRRNDVPRLTPTYTQHAQTLTGKPQNKARYRTDAETGRLQIAKLIGLSDMRLPRAPALVALVDPLPWW